MNCKRLHNIEIQNKNYQRLINIAVKRVLIGYTKITHDYLLQKKKTKPEYVLSAKNTTSTSTHHLFLKCQHFSYIQNKLNFNVIRISELTKLILSKKQIIRT